MYFCNEKYLTYTVKKIGFIIIALLTTLSVASASPARQMVDSIARIIEDNYLSQGTLTRQLVNRLYQIANDNAEDKSLLIQAIYWDTLTEYSHRSNEPALVPRIDSLLNTEGLVEDEYDIALLTYSRALVNMAHGNYMEAFQGALDAYNKAEALKDKKLIIRTLMTLGNVGPYSQNYELSEHYYNELEKLVAYGEPDYYRLYINRTRMQFQRGEYEAAAKAIAGILPDIDKSGEKIVSVVARINLGSYYTGMEQRDKAIVCYEEALELMKNLDNNNYLMLLYGNVGNYHRHNGDYKKAEEYYRKVQQIAVQDSNPDQLASVAYSLSLLYMELDRVDSAYYYLKEYNDLISKLMNSKTMGDYQSYVAMVLESSGNKVKISEQEMALRNRQMIITAVLSVGIIIIIVLLLLVTVQKRRSTHQLALLKEIENQELSQQLVQEHKTKRKQSEKIKDKLREITSYSMLLANKNEILNQVLELSSKQTPDNYKKMNQEIEKLIKNNLNTDDDFWNEFMVHYNQIDPNFFESLKSAYPNLTPNDLKLCAYIKIGLSAKQIAQMQNLSPDSINKNRYRLRKKLNLDKDDSLDDFIVAFASVPPPRP
jgi:DNA-binding HTH domain-containing proteins